MSSTRYPRMVVMRWAFGGGIGRMGVWVARSLGVWDLICGCLVGILLRIVGGKSDNVGLGRPRGVLPGPWLWRDFMHAMRRVRGFGCTLKLPLDSWNSGGATPNRRVEHVKLGAS